MSKNSPQLGLAGLGMELVAAVVGSTLVGVWIDRRYDSEPWGVLIGGMVGIVGGLTNFIRQARGAVEAPPPSHSLGGERDAPSTEDDRD